MHVSHGAEIVGAFDHGQAIEKRIIQQLPHHVADNAQIQHGHPLPPFFDHGFQAVQPGKVLHGLLGDTEGAGFLLALVEQIKGIGLGRADQVTGGAGDAPANDGRGPSLHKLFHFSLGPLQVVLGIGAKLQASAACFASFFVKHQILLGLVDYMRVSLFSLLPIKEELILRLLAIPDAYSNGLFRTRFFL
jgi:hypothetical protein